MATNAWQRTREVVVAIWRRVYPERADSVAGELAQTHEELLAARISEDPQTETELQAGWQGRVRRLLLADPSVAEEFRVLPDEVSPQDSTGSNAVHMHAHVTGNGRVYQAGRDQRILES
ncbi:hypothetical protein ACEYXF_07020 [Streptomyces asiaticus]|uniref:hypothetical protein n=1 Tax=Streptomyces asiaticus TaxID=114695 RepID=UPI0039BE72F6